VLIDAHTHIFPPEVAEQKHNHLERDGWFGQLYRAPRAVLASAQDLLRSMDRNGVDVSVAVSFGWRDARIGRLCAEYMLAASVASSGRILPLAYVQPADGMTAVKQLERDLAGGFRGVGELMPDGQGFSLDDHELLAPLLHLATEANAPVLVHVSEPVGHQYPGKGNVSVAAMWRLARTFPDVCFIAAHWGGGLLFYELMPEVHDDLKHVWYDTAATSYLYHPRIFRAALDLVDQQKLLFASDYPILRQGPLLRSIRALDVAEDAIAGILGGHAAALFNVPTTQEYGGTGAPSRGGVAS